MCVRHMFVALVLGHLLLLAEAVAEDKHFDGEDSNLWNDPDNWDTDSLPDEDDRAFIDDDFEVLINVNTAKAASIEVDDDAVLQIKRDGVLTLHGNGATSDIAGIIEFINGSGINDPVLHLANNHTLRAADAGDPTGTKRTLRADVDAIIRGASGKVLTLVNGSESPLAVLGDFRIEIELVNNATVNGKLGTLTLTDNPKSGSGLWKATEGTLVVNVEVTGDGTWEVGASATIEINVEIDDLTGDVHVLNGGRFLLNESFCSPGSLDWEEGFIEVVDGATFTIAGGCSP